MLVPERVTLRSHSRTRQQPRRARWAGEWLSAVPAAVAVGIVLRAAARSGPVQRLFWAVLGASCGAEALLDRVAEGRPAHFTGTLTGRTLTLSVKLGDGQALGPYTLTLGHPPRLMKCR